MILTKKKFREGLSVNGSYSEKQLQTLGDSMKRKGWRRRVIGKEVSEEAFQKFLELKDKHIPINQAYRNKVAAMIKRLEESKNTIEDLQSLFMEDFASWKNKH